MQYVNTAAIKGNPHRIGAIYARISDDPKDRKWGVERQIADCKAAAAELGVHIPDKYVFYDNDRSAFKDNVYREHYEEFEYALKTDPELTLFFAYKIDRIWRQTDKQITFYKDVMLRHDVEGFLTRGGGYMELDTAEGWKRACNAATDAEVYSLIVSENSRRARLELAREGVRHITIRPYGWEDGGLVVRESEAVYVREMVERLIAGETQTAIARDLNLRGIPTSRGGIWRGRTVAHMAQRASNAALREHYSVIYDGNWEAITTRDQWERVRHALSNPSKRYQRGTGRKYWLTGFVRCGVCGKTMSVGMGRVNGGGAGFRCDPKRSNETVATGCGGVQRAAKPVEWLVKEMMIERLGGDGLRKAVSQSLSDQNKLQELLDVAAQQRSRVDALVEDYASGILNRDQFAKAKSVAEAKLQDIEREIAQYALPTALSKIDFTKSVREVIENADIQLLRTLAELLIKEVRILPQGRGWHVNWVEIDGHRYRFLPELVQVEWTA